MEEMIDKEKLKQEAIKKQAMETGEWIARRLLENPELIKTIPPILFAYYQTWLSICQEDFYSELYEKHFKKYFK